MVTLESLLKTINNQTKVDLCVTFTAGIGSKLTVECLLYCGLAEEINVEEEMKNDVVKRLDILDKNHIRIVID